jgi:prepilin-type N-terminal cleavage/methylation domain-containing protein
VSCREKIIKSDRGLTLLELLLSITIISLIAVAFVQLVAGSLDSWNHNQGKEDLLNTARLAMERMVKGVRTTTWVMMPLMISDPTDPGYPTSSYYPRDILAVSGMIDQDGDGRADEDTYKDINWDNKSGLQGIDDNNDGNIDNGVGQDDDEDGTTNEDPVDGIDNDGDGRVDEDPGSPFYSSADDDDGDGAWDEDVFDPVIYSLNGTTLNERHEEYGWILDDYVIAENVAEFKVLRRRVNGNTLIDIYLRMDNGKDSVALSTTTIARAMFKP